MSLMGFKEYLVEYELTNDVIPSHVKESDIDHSQYKKKDMGTVDGHKITHYSSAKSHHTFVTDSKGETVGHIEHKKTKTAKKGRLAISNVTKTSGSKFGMGNVLHHLIHSGHELESDNTNTESGAHKMLMGLAKRSDVKTHIENGNTGETVHHEGDVTSPENQHKYTVRSTDPDFLDNDKHKHILVFGKK